MHTITVWWLVISLFASCYAFDGRPGKLIDYEAANRHRCDEFRHCVGNQGECTTPWFYERLISVDRPLTFERFNKVMEACSDICAANAKIMSDPGTGMGSNVGNGFCLIECKKMHGITI